MNLIGIYGYIFYELNRVLMRKNVNSEVTMNPPIQHYTYPDDHAPAAAYDHMIGFFSFSTLGTRDFFSRGTRNFVGRRPTRLQPSAEDTSGEAGRKNFFKT